MNCHCHSKELYKQEYDQPDATFEIDNKITLKKRHIDQGLIQGSHPLPLLEDKIIESSEMWLPTKIDKISW